MREIEVSNVAHLRERWMESRSSIEPRGLQLAEVLFLHGLCDPDDVQLPETY